MKKMIKVLAVALLAAQSAMAATQWNGSYAYFWNGTTDLFFDLNAASANPDYTGSLNGTLGTLTQGSFTLFLNAEINADANGGDAYTDMSVYYRLNGGSFTALSDNSLVNTGGDNYRGTPGGADFSALTAGTYTLDLFLSRSHTWGGGGPYTTYLNTTGDIGGGVEPADVAPAGDFFSATFTVVPEPSTMMLAGLGLIGLVAARRRMAK